MDDCYVKNSLDLNMILWIFIIMVIIMLVYTNN